MHGQVEVYFNLRKSTFSVRSAGRVVQHSDRVRLTGCTFVVQPAGLRRVRETGVKNVHAFVRGTLYEDSLECQQRAVDKFESADAQRVRYNPFIFDTFVTQDEGREQGVHTADLVLCEIHVIKHPLMWGWGCE